MDRYEEALERAKEWEREHPNGYVIRDMMEHIFPGYNDSEDERIRKCLVDMVKRETGFTGFPSQGQVLAYLEKQKEQKPAARENNFVSKPQTSVEILRHYLVWAGNSESEEDCPYTWRALADAIRDGIKALEEQKPIFKKGDRVIWDGEEFNILDVDKDTYNVGGYIVPFSREGELHPIGQKPAEWSEEYREEDLQIRFAFYTYKGEDSALYLSNVFVEETSRNKGFGAKILAAAEKVAETLGTIQIRLKVKQNSPANAWYRKHGYGYMTFEDGYDWLEKTLEYMKPAKSAEWSEEDGLARDFLLKQTEQSIKVLESVKTETYIGSKGLGYVALDIRDWKNARQFILSLHPHWKPSEEQMECLQGAIEEAESEGLHGLQQGLIDLMESLKRL